MGVQVNKEGGTRRYWLVFGLAAITVAADQLSKLWIMGTISPYHSVPVIDGFFDLVNIRNRGAAFGFLNSPHIEWQFWLFLVATLVAVGAIVTLTRSCERFNAYLFTGLGLVMGGAVGNLVDRLRFRAVVDFLDFYVGNWHWPAFNVADIAICCGAILTCLCLWRDGDKLPPSGKSASGRAKQGGRP